MAVLQFDDKAARSLEAIYSSADVVAQRQATLERLALVPGESVVDIGCGPGFFQPALRDRARPSTVRGPVLGPPCIRHRPFGMAAPRHGSPSRRLAPHRGEAFARSKARA